VDEGKRQHVEHDQDHDTALKGVRGHCVEERAPLPAARRPRARRQRRACEEALHCKPLLLLRRQQEVAAALLLVHLGKLRAEEGAGRGRSRQEGDGQMGRLQGPIAAASPGCCGSLLTSKGPSRRAAPAPAPAHLFNGDGHEELQHEKGAEDHEDHEEDGDRGVGVAHRAEPDAGGVDAGVEGVDPELGGGDGEERPDRGWRVVKV
jgi:hypothetical protein